MWTCTQNSAWLQLLNTKQRWHKFYCSRKIFCTFIPIALPIPIYTLYFYWIDIIFTCHDLWTSFFSCTDKEKLTCGGWELFSYVLTKKSLLVEDETFFLMYWQRKAYLLRMRALFSCTDKEKLTCWGWELFLHDSLGTPCQPVVLHSPHLAALLWFSHSIFLEKTEVISSKQYCKTVPCSLKDYIGYIGYWGYWGISPTRCFIRIN